MSTPYGINFELVTNPWGIPTPPPDVSDADNLLGALIKGKWDSGFVPYMERLGVQALYLNHQRGSLNVTDIPGWTGSDYGFLSELHWLRLLDVASSTVNGLESISFLHSLETLRLTHLPLTPIEFTALPSLRCCALPWSSAARDLGACGQLERLELTASGNIDEKQLTGTLAGLKRLRKLTILGGRLASLGPLEGLAALEKLELRGCRLSSLEGVEKFQKLHWLSVDGSAGIADFTPVQQLRELEILNISDCGTLPSVKLIAPLRKLRAFAFAGATTLFKDGNLQPLEELPELSMLMFQDRRHYTHRLVRYWNWMNFYQPSRLLTRRGSKTT